MALRHAQKPKITNWYGLQTFAESENLPLGWFTAGNNVVVTNDGSAAVLRSPKLYGDALADGGRVVSINHYMNDMILVDQEQPDQKIRTYLYTPASVSMNRIVDRSQLLVRENQAMGLPWHRLTVNSWSYGLNGDEYVQTDGAVTYPVGIPAPVNPASLSFQDGGQGALQVGVQVAYAYRNSVTHDVSAPSPLSVTSGPTGNDRILRITHEVGSTPGCDQIIFFITVDGGAVPYLLVDANANPVTVPNATGYTDFSVVQLSNTYRDKLTPRTSFNQTAPAGAHFQFEFKDRVFLCDFRDNATKSQLAYSGFESVYYGTPQACFPPLNRYNLTNKQDAARSGIATAMGALILGELDAYLLSGAPSDKTAGPQASITVTEHLEALKWAIGTKSPKTLKTTPYGEFWLDQNKRVQMWTHNSFPTEVGLPIRNTLAGINGSWDSLNMAEAAWYQHGDQGGEYVITASTDGQRNNKLFILSIYRDPQSNELRFAWSVSDIPAQSICATTKCYVGGMRKVQTILDLETKGDGWDDGQSHYFITPVGDTQIEYGKLHSIRFHATNIEGLSVFSMKHDGTSIEEHVIEEDDTGAYSSLIDRDGADWLLKFQWDKDDSFKRAISNMRTAIGRTKRTI
jgi:hypothetical protein